MQPTTLKFRGPQVDVDQLESDLRKIEGVESLSIEAVALPNTGVMGRPPLNQVELVDLVVQFAVSVTARLTADAIKSTFKSLAKSRGFSEPVQQAETAQVSDKAGTVTPPPSGN